jgi:hypothetical protein
MRTQHPFYELGPAIARSATLLVRSGVRHGARGFSRSVGVLSVRPELASSEDIVARVVATAGVFASTAHEGLARVEDVGDVHGETFIVTTPFTGATLGRLLGVPALRDRALEPAVAMQLVVRLADAARTLHEALGGGRALGGLSPDTVWVEPSGGAWLLPDAAVASVAAARAEPNEASGRYCAPELARGTGGDPRADVYALALLLWDLLSLGRAKAPLDAEAPTRATPVSVDGAVVKLVLRSLSMKAEERPADAGAFARELGELLHHDPGSVEARARRDPGGVLAERPVLARLVVRRGAPAGRSLLLRRGGGRWVVGRGHGTDLSLPDPDMSREHFEVIEGNDGRFRVYDLGSKNGLLVNGAPGDGCVLAPGDEVRAGATVLGFSP